MEVCMLPLGLDEIDNTVSNLIKDSNKSLENYDIKTKNKINDGPDRVVSIVYTAIATISILIRRFRTAKLSNLFIHRVNRFVSIITNYVKVFKIDSIQVTIGLAPSIVITLSHR
jgi:hypothetical protein